MSWWQVVLIGCGFVVLFNVLFVLAIGYRNYLVRGLQQLMAISPRQRADEDAS